MAFRHLMRAYARDERGAITLLMLVLFVGVLLTTGMALDMARHESERADLQSAIDRGTLAAASLRQTLNDDDPATPAEEEDRMTAMVESFVASRTLSGSNASVTIKSDIQPHMREVVASADYAMPTGFLRMIGLPSLEVGAVSRAKEGLGNIEISMVLDTTGSMCNPSCDKIKALREHSEGFINAIFANNPAERVSFNVVPYDNHVNIGSWMFDHLSGVQREPDEAPCMRIDIEDDLVARPGTVPNYPADGTREAIDDEAYRWTIGFNGWWYVWQKQPLENVCPSDPAATVRYLSADQAELQTMMRNLNADGSTATYFGMQWGLALLNPATRPLVDEMARPAVGLVSPSMRGRPADWTDSQTDKYLILFTDGAMNSNIDFYTPYGEQEPSMATLKQAFRDQCDFARRKGVIVFTIGFELPPGASSEMTGLLRNCASEGRYYPADRDTLENAFSSIATDIQRLKLIN